MFLKKLCALSTLPNPIPKCEVGSGWENPGPARQVIIDGHLGQLLVYNFSLRELGTLMLAVSGEAGSDPYGNSFPKGMYFPIDFVGQVGPQHSEYIQWGDTLGVVLARQFLQRANSGAPPEFFIQVLDPNATTQGVLHLSTAGKGNGAGVQIGNGKPGLAHSLNATYSLAGVASGTLTAITAVTVAQINSDYPSSGFTGGSWSPPVDGYYDILLFMAGTAASTREACIIRKNGAEFAHSEAANNTNLQTQLISEYLLTTDVITFVPFYTSATTPQTLTGRINISRRVT